MVICILLAYSISVAIGLIKRIKADLVYLRANGIKNKHYWHCAISRMGQLIWANTYNFATKYFLPVCDEINKFYYNYIQGIHHKLFIIQTKYIKGYNAYIKGGFVYA